MLTLVFAFGLAAVALGIVGICLDRRFPRVAFAIACTQMATVIASLVLAIAA